MKYEVLPVVDSYELQRALELRFDSGIMGNEDYIANVLFGDEYSNDCFKRYYFDTDEIYKEHPWQNKEHIRIRNCVNAMLRDMFPNCQSILVDVSW